MVLLLHGMNNHRKEETIPVLRNAFTPFVLLLWCAMSVAADGADIKTHTEVEALLNRHAEAYAKKDPESIMSLFAPDPEVMLLIGGAFQARYVGLAQIRESYEADFAATGTASMKYNWVSVRSREDVAWFATECLSTIEMGKERFSFAILWTGVAEKRNNNWVFVQCHVSIGTPGPSDRE